MYRKKVSFNPIQHIVEIPSRHELNNTNEVVRVEPISANNHAISSGLKRLPCQAQRRFKLTELREVFSFKNDPDDARNNINKMLKEWMGPMFQAVWSLAPTSISTIKNGNSATHQRLIIAQVDFIETLPSNPSLAPPRNEVMKKFKRFLREFDRFDTEYVNHRPTHIENSLLRLINYGPCKDVVSMNIPINIWKRLNSYENCPVYQAILSNALHELHYHEAFNTMEREEIQTKAHQIATQRMENPNTFLYVGQSAIEKICAEYFSVYMHASQNGEQVTISLYASNTSLFDAFGEKLNAAIHQIEPTWQPINWVYKKCNSPRHPERSEGSPLCGTY
jgi:hypothetical protein